MTSFNKTVLIPFFSLFFVLFPICLALSAFANSLDTSSSSFLSYDISINPPIELDNKTKAEVYALRRSSVARYRELIAGEYSPSEAVFGQIEDGKPWWGIEGHYCGGSRRRSTDGVSEETRFILNPFILLGLDEIQAWNVEGSCTPVYPKPVSLQWFARDRRAKVTYAVSDFFRQRRSDGFPSSAADNAPLYLKNINARDFGYEFVYLDPYNTFNISRNGNARMFADSVQLLSFLHCGGSCRQPGGCNNGSPGEPDLQFTVNKLPATLCCKLWKNKPSAPQAEADFTFIIDLK